MLAPMCREEPSICHTFLKRLGRWPSANTESDWGCVWSFPSASGMEAVSLVVFGADHSRTHLVFLVLLVWELEARIGQTCDMVSVT